MVAWKLTVHNDALADLDSSYDGCPTACTRPEADMRRGCPDCEVNVLWNELLADIDEELDAFRKRKEMRRDAKLKWSVNKLISDVGVAGSMDARVNGEGYDENWTTPQRRLVSILREERYSLRKSKDKELLKELKAGASK